MSFQMLSFEGIQTTISVGDEVQWPPNGGLGRMTVSYLPQCPVSLQGAKQRWNHNILVST